MLRRNTQTGRRARRGRRLNLGVNELEGRTLLSTVPMTSADVMGRTGLNGYYTGPVVVTLTAGEPGTATNSLTTEYQVNGGQYSTGNRIVLSQSGANVVHFFTKDSRGAAEATQTLVVKIDLTRPRVSETATPTTLWPPNHKLDTVTVSGRVTDQVSGLDPSRVFFFVRDEYGRVQPRGSAQVKSDGRYSFQVALEASRTGQDHDGRQYTIFVVARSASGQIGYRSARVTVPHDQGHSVGGSRSGAVLGGGGSRDSGDQGVSGAQGDFGHRGSNGKHAHVKVKAHGHGYGQG